MGLVLFVVILLLVLITVPTWRYSKEWGYMPSGILTLLLLVVLVLLVLGHLPRNFG
jgi:hypothetical protein